MGEFTFEPLSVIAADDLITCAAYAKEKNLYNHLTEVCHIAHFWESYGRCALII